MNKLTRLSSVEMEVMQAIWELTPPITVAQLLSHFQESKGWKTSTLSTMLSRLIDKGFLAKTMKGNVNYYDTDVTLYDYQKSEASNMLASLYGGNVQKYVAALVDSEGVTQNDIDSLRQWFRDMAGNSDE